MWTSRRLRATATPLGLFLVASWVGCSAITEEIFDDAGSAAAGGGTAGDAAHGGDGAGVQTGGAMEIACGEAAPPTVGACPSMCTGGCAGGTCLILCEAMQACKELTLDCPGGLHCELLCTAEQACEQLELTCPPTESCTVRCDGVQACKEAKLVAGGGPFELFCTGADDPCDKTRVTCGPNTCRATCAGGDEHPELACKPSCSCISCSGD